MPCLVHGCCCDGLGHVISIRQVNANNISFIFPYKLYHLEYGDMIELLVVAVDTFQC